MKNRLYTRSLVSWTLIFAFVAVSPAVLVAQTQNGNGAADINGGRVLPKPNYELAARWTSQKVGKLVFDTSVNAHWLEFSDRFWYPYENPQGRTYYVVDPAKRTKTPLFDNAKMAATLSTLTRVPFDAQHLPIKELKFIKNDTAIRFGVDVDKDATIPDTKPPEKTDKEDSNSKTKTLYFEHDLATGKTTLLDGFEPPKKPR